MGVFYKSHELLSDEEVRCMQSFEQLLGEAAARSGLAPEHFKLVAAGAVLSAATFTTAALSCKILMIGSAPPPAVPTLPLPRVKDDLTSDSVQASSKIAKGEEEFQRRLRAKSDLANPYRFHDIHTLSGFDDEARARAILQDLSSDPGVIAVMKKHKWSVGCLSEMYPEGYVGVSDVCILGLNKNKGQEILLRLRTDDLKGFRKLLTIKKVLYHELAHNEHSDHDDKFYILMRQIEREVVELDWRQSTKGHVLGRRRHHGSDSDSGEVFDEHQNLQENKSSADESLVNENGNITSQESNKAPSNCLCGCKNILICNVCTSTSPLGNSEKGDDDAQEDNITVLEYPSNSPEEKCISNQSELVEEEKESKENVEENSKLENNSSDDDGRSARILMQIISDRVIRDIDVTLATFYTLQQEPPERVVQLRQAMYEMLVAIGEQARFKEEVVSQQSIAQLLETLTLLRDIIRRAKDSNDPKYKSLNCSKMLFQRVLSNTKALPILYAVGFEKVGTSSDHITLVRDDPAILYMFVDILHKTIDASNETLTEFFGKTM